MKILEIEASFCGHKRENNENTVKKNLALQLAEELLKIVPLSYNLNTTSFDSQFTATTRFYLLTPLDKRHLEKQLSDTAEQIKNIIS